jgi:DNA-binding SARP family transcriptional activator
LAQHGRHLLSRVEALEAMAGVLASQGQTHQAARWLATTKAARQDLGAPIPPVECAGFEQLDQRLRAVLGNEAWSALCVEGGSQAIVQLQSEAMGAAGGLLPSFAAIAPVAPRLRVLALGPHRVFVGDRALASTDWTYAKSKELLFYLLEHGPATKAQIGLDLWPEASPNQLRAAFHSALHHLRRALGGTAWITHTEGQYAFNLELPFEYDAASFDSHLRQARAAGSASPPRTAGRPGAIGHFEAAAALWRGDYLADLEAGDWAVFRRETLRQAFLDGLLQLGELRFAEAHYAAAAEAFRQALSLDGYLELAHRGLMRCYARQGEAGQAGRHYQNLRQTLDSELSTSPSSETTLLYERIRRGDDV